MVSICIPAYNYDISQLTEQLLAQISSDKLACEIIVIDDDSKYHKLSDPNPSINYIELEENIGRARIRNRFLNYAKHEYLLFLDGDSLIIANDFLKNYLQAAQTNPQVVCGGRIYPPDQPGRKKRLRWKYGRIKESKPADSRSKFPYRSFMTNNFMIRKELLEKTPFDERLLNYGHEDTLMGYALKKRNVEIIHIQNPTLNGDIEDNDLFLQKTEEGIESLIKILNLEKVDQDFIEDVSLLQFFCKFKGVVKIIAFGFFLFKPLIRAILTNGFASLLLFDLYKIGHFNNSLHLLDNQQFCQKNKP